MDKQLKDIPRIFYSFHDEKPFSRCIECNRDLLRENCEYLIEKVVRNYKSFDVQDTILDYAVCMNCAGKLNDEISQESSRKIQQYFIENMDFDRRQEWLTTSGEDVEKMVSRCMIKNTEADRCDEFQLCAYCVGDKISLEHPPYMISGAVTEEIMELISDKTRDFLNGFFERHFAPDPSLMSPLPGPKLVLF